MLNAFLFTVLFALVPAYLLSLAHRSRGPIYLLLPLALSFQIGLIAILATLLRQFPFGLTKTLSIVALSSLLNFKILTLWSYQPRKVLKQFWSRPALLLLLLVSLFLVLDNFYIMGHHGWSFQEGGLWKLKTSYFRGPFNTDAERNVILVNSLLRRDASPFLPNHSFAYQILPFHYLALMASHFPHQIMYPYVSGIGLGLTFLFTFLLLSALLTHRPTLLKHPIFFAGLLFLVFCHSDLLHMGLSLYRKGNLGLEADGSYPWMFFRNFSLKLTTLLSPHHVFFFIFILLFLSGDRLIAKSDRAKFYGLSFLFAFVSSPIFSTFFFPFFALSKMFRQRRHSAILKKQIGIGLGVIVTAYFLHLAVLGFSAGDLYFRRVNGDISFLSIPLHLKQGWFALLLGPTLWVSCLGVLGIPLTWQFLRRLRSRKRGEFFDLYFLTLIAGNLFVYYILRGAEIQRHFTILSCVLAAFFIARNLKLKTWGVGTLAVIPVLTLAILGHAYFIYAFTQKPNVVEANVPWQDYFAMNQFIQSELKSPPCLAAITFRNGGFPLTMEATTSFSTPMDAFIYHRLNDKVNHTLMRAYAQRHIAPFGTELGYQYILWGPIEEQIWGPRVKGRFIRPENKVAQRGKVEIYRLEDALRKAYAHPPSEARAALNHREELGGRLMDGGWYQEAFEEFEQILRLDASRSNIQKRMGQMFLEGGRGADALQYFLKAASLNPGDLSIQKQILAAQAIGGK